MTHGRAVKPEGTHGRTHGRASARACLTMHTVDRACWHGRAPSQTARFLVYFRQFSDIEEHNFFLILVILERELGEQ